ncbi:MAG: UDP-N-acetylmuramoyl-L-alanine--D-glutamate ligase [Acidobacteria bacterium]|nr:UDP-N-acetylmuramoyl-L-alanine--D-glutamate ligase [Acidobacteriota bacterium]
MDLRNKKVTVVGLGRTGLATASFVLKRGGQVTVTDSKPASELASEAEQLRECCELVLGGHPQEIFSRADLIIVSPGVPLAIPPLRTALEGGIPVLSEVELAFCFLRGQVIGITGSNGKTTTTTLTGEILSAAGFRSFTAGNIGVPLIAFVDQSQREDAYVTELSSFQLEAIREFRPRIGVLLNITPDHLDRYTSMEEYAAAKKALFRNQRASDFAVLNAEDARAVHIGREVRSFPLFFSRQRRLPEGVFLAGGVLWYQHGGRCLELMKVEEIPLRGAHNQENVMAALAVGVLWGADPGSMRKTVRNFRGVEHRLEFVAEVGGVAYYNDSKATNVDSTIKAVEAFHGNLLLILGGKDKGGDFSVLRPVLKDRVKHLLLIGAVAAKIHEALADLFPASFCSSLEEAVQRAARMAGPGDTVLLAPACASFDMFQNFEHRGRVFKDAVRALRG